MITKKYSTTLPLKDYLTIKISTNIFQIHYTTTNTKKIHQQSYIVCKKQTQQPYKSKITHQTKQSIQQQINQNIFNTYFTIQQTKQKNTNQQTTKNYYAK